MQSVMSPGAVYARFDDRNLVKYGGLVSVVRLAERCGLPELGADLLRWKSSANSAGAHPVVKMLTLVFGMVVGADSIEDMDRLRHGAMGKAFAGIRAPVDTGFVPAGVHPRPCPPVGGGVPETLPALASHAPLLSSAAQIACVDIDDTVRRTYGYAKQGAGIGYSKVKGFNALIGCVSSPLARPVVVAARLRRGTTNSARRGEFRGRGDQNRPRCRRDRVAGGAGRFSVLRRRGRRCGQVAGHTFLGHGQDESVNTGRDQRHRRIRVDRDPIPASGVGRRGAALDLRRRDRPHPLHRVCQQTQASPCHRDVDRAAGQAPGHRSPAGPG